MLYPLSYEGGDGAKCGAKFAATPCAIKDKVTSASEMRRLNEYASPLGIFGSYFPAVILDGITRFND